MDITHINYKFHFDIDLYNILHNIVMVKYPKNNTKDNNKHGIHISLGHINHDDIYKDYKEFSCNENLDMV